MNYEELYLKMREFGMNKFDEVFKNCKEFATKDEKVAFAQGYIYGMLEYANLTNVKEE